MKILPWFDTKTIQNVIISDFPDFKIEKIILINNSWDNLVAEINDRYIFRFPKDDGIGKNFKREIKILDLLKNKITLAIPEVKFFGKVFVYMGYEKIPGGDLTPEIFTTLNLAEKQKLIFDLANFLKEIHEVFSFEKARELGVEDEALPTYSTMAKKFLPKIKNSMVLDFIQKTCDEYDVMTKEQPELVFLFNDLHTENMAFDYDNKKLNGIFDFSDLAIGDVNLDFHPFCKFDPYFMKAVAEKYQELTGRRLSLRRMVIYSRINELCDLAEFIDRPESRVYKNAMERIDKWLLKMDLFKE
jgi:aminoglycoside phosphotransferase (APT) family kinase protein